jgi:hypothetical protein
MSYLILDLSDPNYIMPLMDFDGKTLVWDDKQKAHDWIVENLEIDYCQIVKIGASET